MKHKINWKAVKSAIKKISPELEGVESISELVEILEKNEIENGLGFLSCSCDDSCMYLAGCLDTLKTWQGILVDGHHRYKICQKHSLSFQTEELFFDDREAVKIWMIRNQMGRRNITDAAKIKYALLSEEIERERAKKRMLSGKKAEKDPSENFRGGSGKVAEIIGKMAGVSDRTVEKFRCIQEKASEDVVKALCEGTPVDGKKLSIDKVYREVQRQEKKEILKATEFPKGKYRIIYADPPWSYNDNKPPESGGAADEYQTRPLEDICNLPVQDITDKEAVLFLWATTPLLQEGLDVMKAWGFEYKSLVIWDKVRPFTGNYFSVQQEFLLLGTKGSCLPDCNERPHSIIRVEKGRHSEKPEEFRRLIEQMYKYGNKVESSYLLANKKRAGRSMEMNWKSNQQIPNHLAFDRFVETFGVDLDKLKQRPEGADRASRRYYKSQRKGGSNPDTQLSLFSEATTTSGS